MSKMQLITLLLLIIGVLVLGYIFFGLNLGVSAKRAKIALGGEEWQVEIADSARLRMRGLSGHDPLQEKEGMLFLFDQPGTQVFWMKDMKFPIDIIWFQDERLVGMTKNAAPEPGRSVFSLKTYASPPGVNRVLEINAGLADKYNLQIGDTFSFIGR